MSDNPPYHPCSRSVSTRPGQRFPVDVVHRDNSAWGHLSPLASSIPASYQRRWCPDLDCSHTTKPSAAWGRLHAPMTGRRTRRQAKREVERIGAWPSRISTGCLTNRAYAAAPHCTVHKRNSTLEDGRRQFQAHVRRPAVQSQVIGNRLYSADW